MKQVVGTTCLCIVFGIILLAQKCEARFIEGPKGTCEMHNYDLMSNLRMQGPELAGSEFDTNFGLPFNLIMMSGQQYRYRFISAMKMECFGIEGNMPKNEGPVTTTPTPINGMYSFNPQPINIMGSDMLLICYDCKIAKLTSNITDSLTSTAKYVFIDFAGSKMTEVAADALTNLSHLTALNLDDNSLTALPDELFAKLERNQQNGLQLSLRNNKLSKISKSFCDVKDFEFADLQNNQIGSLEVECNVNVVHLNVSSNFISRFSLNWLENYDKLSLLDLSFNNLHTIMDVEQANLDSLKYLLLNDNKLNKLGRRWFRRFVNLQSLVLRNNEITVIDSESFKDLNNLVNLDLSRNSISDIPFGIFTELERLIEFNVAENKLTKLSMQTFAGLTELKYLNLSNNLLRHIASTDLLQIKQLQAIDLSSNRLQTLDAKAIMAQHSITWMALKNNFWNCRQLLEILQFTKEKYCNVKRGVLFNVPNIHGIPCTTKNVTWADTMDFPGFLNNLSDEKEMELILSKIDSVPVDDINVLEEIVRKIQSLVLLIAVLFVVDFVFQWLFRLYQARHTINLPISHLK